MTDRKPIGALIYADNLPWWKRLYYRIRRRPFTTFVYFGDPPIDDEDHLTIVWHASGLFTIEDKKDG